MSHRLNFVLCCVLMVCCLVLGGGTRPGFLSDSILQLIALPCFLYFGWQVLDQRGQPDLRPPLYLLALAVFLVGLQLVPMPPSVWTMLPGREMIVESFELLGRELPWWPLSLSPNSTWLSLLALIPPIAVFFGTVLLGYHSRRNLVVVVIGLGVVSALFGLVQVAQGPTSSLRFFEITNPNSSVGFFANSNHFAALMYSVMVLCFAFFLNATRTLSESSGQETDRFSSRAMVPIVVSILALVCVLAAQIIARSRAGVGLSILALFGFFALSFFGRRDTSTPITGRLMYGAIGLVILFSSQFALYRVLERFTVEPLADERVAFARNTMEAAFAYMPFGSGLGTFVPVYALFEKASDAGGVFANHAHNDYLEIWLEWGASALVVFLFFAVWYLLRSVLIWRSNDGGSGSKLDLDIARSAGVVVFLILLHSLVDYPLRTSAMMAVFAFSCGLMIAPASSRRSGAHSDVVAGEAEISGTVSGSHGQEGVPVHAGPTDGPETQSPPVHQPWEPAAEQVWPGQDEGEARDQSGGAASDAAYVPGPPPEGDRAGSEASPARKSAPGQPGNKWGEEIEWPEEWGPPKK